MAIHNPLKRRLIDGDRLLGLWIASASPTNVEIVAHAGYDFLIVDQEHGAGSIGDAVAMLRAAEAAGTACVVRVPWNDPVYLKRILDVGFRSVMIPMVESAEEAVAAVRACRYPPEGARGYAAPGMRCSRYGFEADYRATANEELLIIAQIESARAASVAEAIAATPGIDLAFIGVNDLAGSIGFLEDLDRPEVRSLVRLAEAGIRRAGRPLGTVPSPRRGAVELFRDGYRMVAASSDVVLLREAARAEVGRMRAALS
jgi:4-hydroxy-2-oxoheptanedioate aldolase